MGGYSSKHTLYVDGSAREDGPTGVSAILTNSKGKVLWSGSSRSSEKTTASQAEYQSVIYGLKEARKLGARNVNVVNDNQSNIRQMQGRSKVRSNSVKPLYSQACKESKKFDNVNYTWTRKQKNKEAHKVAREASRKK